MGGHPPVTGTRRGRWLAVLAVVAVAGVVAAGVALTRSDGPVDDRRPSVEEADDGAGDAPATANPLVTAESRNPSILRTVDGTYVAYVDGFDAGESVRVMAFSSPDLVTWDPIGEVLADPGAWADGASGAQFTTPSVRYVPEAPPGARYVMYLSGPTAADARTCVGVATAAAPEGPFVGADEPLLCPPGGARSASAVPGSDQVVYRAAAGIQAITLDPGGTTVPTGAEPVLLAPVEDGILRRQVLERPAVARDPDGRAYLFVRTGDEDDGVAWSPCRTSGPLVTTCAARTALGSWLAATPDVRAPGGVQVVADADGAQWIAYHATSGSGCGGRDCITAATMRLDRLCFAHGVPRTDGPTVGRRSLERSEDCSDDVPGRELEVTRVVDDEVVDQPDEVTFREGGASVPLGGRLLWLFADTYIDPATRGEDGVCAGTGASRSNTAGLGLPHPLAGRRGYASPLATVGPSPGCADQLVPLTRDEEAYTVIQSDVGRRVVLWESGGIPLEDGSALVFFVKGVQDRDADADGPEFGCGYCRDYHGLGVVRITPGQRVADRASTPVGCLQACLFGPADGDWFGRPFLADGYVYMYSDSPTPIVRLARAPLDRVTDRAAWTFLDAEGAWSPDVGDAAAVGGLSDRPPLVSYDAHLDRYVSIASGGDTVTIQTAPHPWGPWGEPTAIHDLAQQECAGIDAYGAVAAPWLDDGGGRTIRFAYARPGPSFGADPDCPGQVRLVTVELA